MEQSRNETNGALHNEEEKNLSEILAPYLNRWKFILAGLIIAILLAVVYLRLATREYMVTSKITIRDESRGQSLTDLNVFQDLGFGGTSGNVDNEIEVLNSVTLMERVTDSLNLNVSYYDNGLLGSSELYGKSPIEVYVDDYNGHPADLRISLESDGRFHVEDNNGSYSVFLVAGEKTNSPWGTLSVNFSGITGEASYPVFVRLAKWNGSKSVSIQPVSKTSSVVSISTVTPVPEKSMDVIDALVHFYNMSAIEEKRWVTEQTIRFIDERLSIISGELDNVEKDVETYKKKYQLTDMEAEAGLYLSSGSEYDKRIVEIEMQKNIMSSLENYVSDSGNRNNAIPTNLGMADISLTSLIEQYNEMQIKRRESAAAMTPNNPVLQEMDNNLNLLRNDILQGLKSSVRNYDSSLAGLRSKESTYSSKIRNLSTNEREFRGFIRQQQITESIYLYLLQKREESAISLTMVTPNARIIDKAYTLPDPVKPKRMMVLLAAFMLGILVPVGLIYIRELLNITIRSREDLEKLVKAPILGIVPEIEQKDKEVIENWGTSGAVEMYRLLSINMEFMMTGKDDKVIMVTSSVPKEGKSSFAVNFAVTWSTIGKKVLLVDLDLRASKLANRLHLPGQKGMSSYLSDDKTGLNDIVMPLPGHANVDIIPAGIFPPNPVRLLLGDRLDSFFAEARKQYDIIIVDTPPVLQVTDSLIINRVSDATVYVTRSGITDKRYLRTPEELSREKKLNNLSYVLKGVTSDKGYGYGGYGYGYGYGYKGKQKNRWLRLGRKMSDD